MIICLTGMHRSGTSLMSSYLEHCGITMGESLVGPAKGNPRGHFEDVDFVSFHDEILADNRCHMYAPRRHLTITQEQGMRAAQMIRFRNAKFDAWGWKDPRTTLFLDHWVRQIPSLPVILLYRHPHLVADSLFKRATDRRLSIMPWLAYRAWIEYNSRILAFHQTHRARCIVMNIQGIAKKSEKMREALSHFLGYPLEFPYNVVYKQDEIAEEPLPRTLPRKILEHWYRSRLMSLYYSLEAIATIPEAP